MDDLKNKNTQEEFSLNDDRRGQGVISGSHGGKAVFQKPSRRCGINHAGHYVCFFPLLAV